MSQTTAATFTVDAFGNVTIASLTPGVLDPSASSATLTFDANRQLTGLQLTAPAGSVSWDSTVLGGGTVGCGNGVCTASKNSGASEGLIIDPYFVGWNYQSFGVWETGTANSGTFGAMSFGAPTPVNALPSIGTAMYTGLTSGVYVDGATGQLFGTAANMSATADFGVARSISFSTTGTQISTASGALTARQELNMTGILNINGSGQFTGAVNTAPGFPSFNLSGTATGRFYGPAAQEIGGVYSLTRPQQVGEVVQPSMGGAFGGKQ
jgi:hypothetical protein